MTKPFVITIVGAESSGKTTLALLLSELCRATYVPEFAREYLHSINRPYELGDLVLIANEQLKRIEEAINGFDEQHEQEKEVHSNTEKGVGKLLNIIDGENKRSSSSKIIVDGGLLTLKMWTRIKYQTGIKEVDRALEEDLTDLYILVRPRHYWEADPLREAPEIVDRVWIYNQYLVELAKGNIPFIIFPFE